MSIHENAMTAAVFCSRLCTEEGVQPLEPRQWHALSERLKQMGEPVSALLRCGRSELSEALGLDPVQTERLLRLRDRSGSLALVLEKYSTMGIGIVTTEDGEYPRALREKLGGSCPPLFYTAGKTELLERKAMGFVGSRSAGAEDLRFTRRCVRKAVENGYAVVSGGARGTDSAAESEAVSSGGSAVSFLSDSMLKKLKNAGTVRAVQEGRLLLLSAVHPEAGFQAGVAMMRNRYIYAHSSGTVVIRADYQKGGTWAGAADALRRGWSPVLCRNSDAPGNRALIEKGAVPIDEDWDGTVPEQMTGDVGEQMSLF